ncbi:hypothetical protein, partial [Candidatus Hodgkinia cicadicola]|uniref:hypothetical protein n=1 Tax=Candidatus Hodgkinia cicadicola TaxID=573658 RepID=UPI002414E4D6
SALPLGMVTKEVQWLGHIHQMLPVRNITRINTLEEENRLQAHVEEDLRIMSIFNWRRVAVDRRTWSSMPIGSHSCSAGALRMYE